MSELLFDDIKIEQIIEGESNQETADGKQNTLDEWMYFLKNSEVKDEFKAKALKEAGEVLDIMRLKTEDRCGYNRYLDNLHLKASEIFTLKSEAEFEVIEAIVRKLILNGAYNHLISVSTGLTFNHIEQLRNELKR